MSDLLFEIGMEEIPAGFLQPALQQLKDNFVKKSAALKITHGVVRTMGTPRRLALIVEDLAAQQADSREELLGPSKKAGFDDQGEPSKAALGFARSKGVDASELQLVDTPKGEYLMLVREVAGKPTSDLLSALLKELLLGFSFAKSMRWGSNLNAFARPIQWLLAINGDQRVDLEHDGIISGRTSYGHRFMAPVEFKVQDASGYEDQLADHRVVVDPAIRRQQVLTEIEHAVATTLPGQDAHVAVDENLVNTVTNLVEYPVGVCGEFDDKFLQLPPEVLITSMREHQKYFPVVDEQEKLLPCFVAVNNTVVKELSLTRAGHERVLNARLEDALFFFDSDQQRTLEDRYDDLKGIVFQAKLGTMLDKSERIIKLSGLLAEKIVPEHVDSVCRTARLAKIDLLTDMVGEFPTLQGIMGAAYAVHDGESTDVVLGITDHYLPKRAGDNLPVTATGALVGLADRIDTIVGCFGIGQLPTGTTDPFGLRRLSLAVIHIIADRGYQLSLRELVSKALALYGSRVDASQATVDAIVSFIQGRYVNDCIAAGLDAQAVDAVCSVNFDDINDCRRKIDALAAIRADESFSVLAASFKRIRNILKGHQGQALDSGLLQEDGEQELARVYAEVASDVEPLLATKDYGQALAVMLRLKGSVDAFFESVMVMAEDDAVRNNRLNLLAAIAGLFLAVGDISKMQE